MFATSAFIKCSHYYGRQSQAHEIHKTFLRDQPSPEDGSNPDYGDAVKAFLAALNDKSKEEIKKLFNDAVAQAEIYDHWVDKEHDVKDFDDMLRRVDDIVAGPPKFDRAKRNGNTAIRQLIGVPIYLVFDLISNTSAGYTLLCRDDFNAAIKALLCKWHNYLQDETKDSNKTLTDWFSEPGMAMLEAGLGDLHFDETFVTEVKAPTRYKTWDSFFTRRFKEKRPDGKTDVRPIVPQPKNQLVFYIYNPCESTVFRIATNVQLRDTFWVKSQNYSLCDMLGVGKVTEDNHGQYAKQVKDYAKRLVGASVLQSFLAPQNYHRWHSPVDGTIRAAVVVAGTYYAALPDEGAPTHDLDLAPGDPHGALVRSQPWISVSASRAIIIIEPPEDSVIDLVAFIAVGMGEVSTCEIDKDIKVGKGVKVGNHLGTFRFGGSTYVLVVKLKEDTKHEKHELVFQDSNETPLLPGQHHWIHSVIGQVRTTMKQP